ncbi:MAG: rhodanese-like domain-containing protein [Kiritimatiellae bacterium]|jgi:phage shock protein E|nr:rhodanese-like domain-containing protein [Kiritimatiellia bacterium]
MIENNAILIDVRSEEEFAAGHIDGAINIPYDVIDEKIEEISSDKTKPLYLYCRSGRRVGLAIDALQPMGYTNLHNLGGFEEAKKKWEQ